VIHGKEKKPGLLINPRVVTNTTVRCHSYVYYVCKLTDELTTNTG